jgi:hypothetical protein
MQAKDAGLVERCEGEGSIRPRVLIMSPRMVTCTEVAPPVVNETDQVAADRLFDEAMANNDGLFDGPVVLCNNVTGWNTDDLAVSWSRASYRIFALRRFNYRGLFRSWGNDLMKFDRRTGKRPGQRHDL